MSFFGGGNKKADTPGAKAMEIAKQPTADSGTGSAKSVHGFDPEALERAAKAAAREVRDRKVP